jgi:hypothetical protein
MLKSVRLGQLHGQVKCRANRLRLLATESETFRTPEAYRQAAYVAIEAYNLWWNFQREYYLACSFMSPRRVSGGKVENLTPGVSDEMSALAAALVANGRPIPAPGVPINPRLEPDWSQKSTLMAAATQFSNIGAIASGLSIASTMFAELPSVRIFCAHRNENTARKVRNIARNEYGLSALAHPLDLVNDIHRHRTQSLLLDWIWDIETMSELMCT